MSHYPVLNFYRILTLQLHYLQDSDSDSCTKRSRPAATKPAGKSTNRPRGRPALDQKKQPAPPKASKAQKLKLKEEKMKETVNRKRKKVCFIQGLVLYSMSPPPPPPGSQASIQEIYINYCTTFSCYEICRCIG